MKKKTVKTTVTRRRREEKWWAKFLSGVRRILLWLLLVLSLNVLGWLLASRLVR